MIRIGKASLKDIKIGREQVLRVMLRGQQIFPSSITPPPQPPDPPQPPQPTTPEGLFEIRSKSAGTSIYFSKISSKQTFKKWDEGWIDINEGDIINIENDTSLYIAGKLRGQNSNTDFSQLLLSGSVELVGKSTSLSFYDFDKDKVTDFLAGLNYAFYGLFANSPATINCDEFEINDRYSTYSFASMFEGCSGLISYPTINGEGKIPENCFNNTFKNCNNTILGTKDITLNFEGVNGNGVYTMFDGAEVNTVTINLTGNVEQSGMGSMLKNSKVKKLYFYTGDSNFYNYACDSMLDGCKNITDIYTDVKPSQIQARYCFSAWAINVSDSGTIHLRSDMDLSELQGIDGLIPRYWNVIQDL